MKNDTPQRMQDAPLSATPDPTATGLMQTESARAIAEVQAAMVVARQFPRDVVTATDRIKNACTRMKLAQGALYCYTKGNTDITGPSIRLAEVLAQCWGNMQFGVRELSNRNGESVVQAYAWDMETNVRSEKSFTVPHIRYSKKYGNKKLEDPRDVYEAVANQGARRLRACILAVIPGDVVEEAQDQIEETLNKEVDMRPETIKNMVKMFVKMGVTQLQIEKRIQRRIGAIQPAQVLNLQRVYTSIKDGMGGVSDWFDPDDSTPTDTGTKDTSTKKDTSKAAATVAGEPDDDLDMGMGKGSEGSEATFCASFWKRVQGAEIRMTPMMEYLAHKKIKRLTESHAADALDDFDGFLTGFRAWENDQTSGADDAKGNA